MRTGYSSIFPGVDHLPTRLPRLDRYGHAWCIVCRCRNGRAVAGDGLCDLCRHHHPARYGHGLTPCECHRCGQRLAVPPAAPRVCDPCRELDRQPQGETVQLFQPAPAVMPGQLAF